MNSPLAAVSSLTAGLLLCAGCQSPATVPLEYIGPRSTLTDDEAAAARTACMFQSGTTPGLSLFEDALLGSQIPIDTIVVLIMENRSFDHLFANLKNAGQSDADVDIIGATNPDAMGNIVTAYHEPDLCFDDTSHSWLNSHIQYNGGKNDGFVTTNANGSGDPVGKRGMSYYTEVDLPYTYGLANTFAIGDRYFCSLLGPTFPNRFFAYAATSFGNVSNNIISTRTSNIFESMAAAALDWYIYFDTTPGSAILLETFSHYFDTNVDELPQFFADAQAGTLHGVNFVDPDLRNEDGAGTDFHPPGDVQNAEAFLSTIVSALMKSPQWPHLALFVTFDEHGGLYDHVAPPPACPPDNIAPMLSPGDPMAGFDRYGFRVPLIVISPYAKPHYVSHHVYDHTSILRFIEARFNLAALTARDANAEPPYDLFDFTKAALLSPPALPATNIDHARAAACAARFPATAANTPAPGDMAESGAIGDMGAPGDQ